jgi:hypothetical protein
MLLDVTPKEGSWPYAAWSVCYNEYHEWCVRREREVNVLILVPTFLS